MAVNKNLKKYYGGEKIAFEQVDNIVLVDPNKIINSDGQLEERLVEHENLVMYANLEANVIPRTKLSLGENTDQKSRTLTIANFGATEDGKINFLKPQGKDFFDATYTDQLTGQNTLNGDGINQTQIFNNQGKRRVRNVQDTQLLGITNITIKNNASFIPQVDIEMVDIQGRTLFELGENSPYSAFFQLPYPLFFLTVKGYYGKAVRYELMMKSFNARFDPTDGNYKISLSFIGRTPALLSDLSLGALYALPHMYEINVNVDENNKGIANNESEADEINRRTETRISSGIETTTVIPKVRTRGDDILNSVYLTYISKGLIDENLPRLSLSQLELRLSNLEEFVKQQFGKEDLSVLNDIENYKKTISDYRTYITLLRPQRWAGINLDPNKRYVDKDGNIYYTLKKSKNNNIQDQKDVIESLGSKINEYNQSLTTNSTFGSEGSYTILNKKKSSSIPVDISPNDIITQLSFNDIDIEKTYILQKNATPTSAELEIFRTQTLGEFEITEKYFKKDFTVDEDLSISFYKFGEIVNSSNFQQSSFLDKLNSIEKQFTDNAETIQKELSAALSKKIESPDGGLGFRPTIRNVMAILIANVDAFYRLMDEVHREAWNLKDDPIRKGVIISSETSDGVESIDAILGNDNENFVYPWPLYFEQEVDGKNVRNVIKYIGDPSVESRTRAYLYDKWPEVEFVEQFIRGDLQRREEQKSFNYRNSKETIPAISVNTVEYPYNIVPYTNLSEVNFLYELWERTYLSSFYTKLFRIPKTNLNMSQVVGEFEAQTIIEAIKENPFLSKKLKNYALNSNNFEQLLKSVSNEGQGDSWGKFLTDVFVTPYIREYETKFQALYPLSTFNFSPKPTIAVEVQQKLRDYLESTESNKLTLTDVYPLTNLTWLQANIQKGYNIQSTDRANQTTKSLFFVDDKKIITSFDPSSVQDEDFSFTPTMLTTWYTYDSPPINLPSKESIKERYDNKVKNYEYFVTEGKIEYNGDYSGFVGSSIQTTSLLNTPYFINAIDDAVTKRKNNIENPYVSLGYLFLNSLPLQTLREKMNNGNREEPFNDYNFAIYNKFSALHRLPYAWVVKYGSIWYRYKKYVQTQTDILDKVWENIDEDKLFDPETNKKDTKYNITTPSGVNVYSMDNSISATTIGQIQGVDVGFYPKIVNNINYLFNYQEIITGYTQNDFNNYFSGNTSLGGDGLKIYENINSRINFNLGSIINEPNKSLTITNNYVFYDKPELYDDDENEKVICYPSAGGDDFNQYRFEVTDTNNKVKEPLKQPLYDGSVKSLWGVSHYGYFDSSLIGKPDFDEYVKTIDTNKDTQESFNLLNKFEYSSIEELFAVFNEDVLNLFEAEFLKYCKDPNRDNVSSEYPNLLETLKSLFFVDRPDLTGDVTKDGKLIAEKQKEGFKREVQKLFDFKVIFKQGNPSNFNRRVWNSFSNITENNPNQKINFGEYVNETLPTSGGTITLSQSIDKNPDAWEALRLTVGKYRADGIKYSNNGSVITDFFPEMNVEFTANNVRQLSHIIKMYATQKFERPNLTASEFMNEFNEYLTLLNDSQREIQNILFKQLNTKLPNFTTEEDKIESSIKGDVVKLELYDFFKTLNDKWISGGDFQERTIFEDFLFLDRANRDIGNKLIVNIDGLQRFLNARNSKNSIYTLIGHVIQSNNMLFMALPSYTNFYGISEPSPNAQPREGKEDSASSVFGTFTEVDYLDNRPKFLCLYTDRVSEQLNMKNNIDYRYGDDSTDLFKDSTLREDQQDKNDFSFSNKVVAFNVDFGVRNQNIFQSVSLDQSQFKDTSESFLITTDIANQAKGSKTFQQSTSLYNLYKNRSYTCQITSMGNVMIQPTMYFNLRYLPMFTGPYWILNVSHTISPGNFLTTFSGVRMSKFSFPDVKDLVMSVNLDLLQKINKKQKRQETAVESVISSIQSNEDNILREFNINKNSTQSNGSFCKPIDQYSEFEFVDKTGTTLGYSEIVDYIESRTIDNNLKLFFIGIIWREQGYVNGSVEGLNNNYVGLTTDSGSWSGLELNKVNGQFCISNTSDGRARSYFSFNDPSGGFDVLFQRINGGAIRILLNSLLPSSPTDNDLAVAFSKVYIGNWYRKITQQELQRIINDPKTTDEKLIQTTYNNSIPIFEKAIQWSKNYGI